MNKKRVLKIILWVIVLATAVGIFAFSSQDATESDETSGAFLYAVLGIFPFFKAMDGAAQAKLVDNLMFIARKCAHFSIYAFLGFWLLLLAKQYLKTHTLPATCAAACLYAVTDEIHQLFVPGRSGQPRDVLIDTCGALTGALIAMALGFFWQILQKNVAHRR